MSEYIDATEHSPRVSALLEFVDRVRDGASAGTIAVEYRDAIEGVEPYDILIVEDRLLADGASIPAVKDLFDSIREELRPGLEPHSWDRPERGHPVETMLREHRAIETHLEELDRLAGELGGASSSPFEVVSELRDHVEALESIDAHFVRKENELFPHLEEHLKHDGSIGVLWSLHDDIRSIRSTLEGLVTDRATNPDTLSNLVSRYCDLFSGLLFKEEFVIFPVALEVVSETDWAQIQQESRDIGYFEIDPAFALLEEEADDQVGESGLRSSAETETRGGLASGSVALGLETGTLELDQLQLLLDTIPVDVTYVDENDRVRYFNNPADRIFPRSGSIIGRSVQNCHPPESVDTVEEILEAFKAGEEDSARFWIQNDEDFVVIDYHALRDGSETYRGTLEVTREVSDIRALEGEQRLIEWGD